MRRAFPHYRRGRGAMQTARSHSRPRSGGVVAVESVVGPLIILSNNRMTQVAQIIMTGLLSPAEACREINMAQPITIEVGVAEPGWHFWSYSFQIVQNHIYVVVNYSHDDNIDRGVAVAMMRASMRNLVNWLLLGQLVTTSATIELVSDEVMAHYEGDPAWVAHIMPENKGLQTLAVGSNDGIALGIGWLPHLLADRGLLYALQDFSSSLRYSEFSLFFLYRAVEWIMWEYDVRESFSDNPDFALAANALGLSADWLVEIGRLSHTHTRHARLRVAPDPGLVTAARERVRHLIARYIDVKHKGVRPYPMPSADSLTGWKPPTMK